VRGVAGQEVVLGEPKKSNKSSKPLKMFKNGAKAAGVPHIHIALKIAKNAVFYI
jgi:hypothetical protein